MMSLSIRPVLRLDAAITGATALLMLAGASPLADLLDLPIGLLVGAVAMLAPYVAYLLWLASREAVPRTGVLLTIGANVLWAVGCVTLLLARWLEPNALGAAFVLIQAVAVLVFADLQVLSLRASRPERPRRAVRLEV